MLSVLPGSTIRFIGRLGRVQGRGYVLCLATEACDITQLLKSPTLDFMARRCYQQFVGMLWSSCGAENAPTHTVFLVVVGHMWWWWLDQAMRLQISWSSAELIASYY